MNLLILTEADQVDGARYRVEGDRVAHIRGVLKKSVGDSIAVGLLNGGVGEALVVVDEGNAMEFECGEMTALPDDHPVVDLICALPRPMTLRKILFTAGMMGIREVHLIRANRVERSFFQTLLLQPDKYRPLLIDGLGQGRRTRLPRIIVHDRFKPFVQDTISELEADGPGPLVKALCLAQSSVGLDAIQSPGAARYIFAVGPEGGWVPFEVDLWNEAGFQPFCLGNWTLRVEHAVTAALSQLALLTRPDRQS